MKQAKSVLLPIATGLFFLVYGIVTGNHELFVGGLVAGALGVMWKQVARWDEQGSHPLRGRLPRRAIGIAVCALALFAVATAWGVARGIIPGALVAVMGWFVAAAPIVAAPYLLIYWIARRRARAALEWPTTVGTVTSSFMEETASEWPAPIILYEYAVDDRIHRGSRVMFGGSGAMEPRQAEEILAACPIGGQIPVYYNPARPGQCSLIPGTKGPNRGLLLGAVLSAGACLLGAGAIALMVVLGLVDAALTAIVGHRVLP